MKNVDIDRWIPNYNEMGFSLVEARQIAEECEDILADEPSRVWTDILDEVAMRHGHPRA